MVEENRLIRWTLNRRSQYPVGGVIERTACGRKSTRNIVRSNYRYNQHEVTVFPTMTDQLSIESETPFGLSEITRKQ